MKVLVESPFADRTMCQYAVYERLSGNGTHRIVDENEIRVVPLTKTGADLARRLLAVPGVNGLNVTPNTVTVKIDAPGLWSWEKDLHPAVLAAFGETFGVAVEATAPDGIDVDRLLGAG